MFGLGLIWMLLFWGGVILLAVWLIAELFPASPPFTSTSTPNEPAQARDILDRRYAAGELTREQYEEMRQTISR